MWIFTLSVIYIIPNTLGTHNSMSVNGESGMLKEIPVSAEDNKLIYDPSVLGLEYLDCSNRTLSLIDFKIKDHNGYIVKLHDSQVSFAMMVCQRN